MITTEFDDSVVRNVHSEIVELKADHIDDAIMRVYVNMDKAMLVNGVKKLTGIFTIYDRKNWWGRETCVRWHATQEIALFYARTLNAQYIIRNGIVMMQPK